MDDQQELNGAIPASKSQATPEAEIRPEVAGRRIERLQDLLIDALKEPDPLRASLRAATADLLEIGYRLSDAIKETMSKKLNGPEMYDAVTPAIITMTLVHRQTARFVQLERERSPDKKAK